MATLSTQNIWQKMVASDPFLSALENGASWADVNEEVERQEAQRQSLCPWAPKKAPRASATEAPVPLPLPAPLPAPVTETRPIMAWRSGKRQR